MHMRIVRNLRFDDDSGTLRIAGENGFGKEKTVYIDIANAEMFLNAIKSAFQMTGKNVAL